MLGIGAVMAMVAWITLVQTELFPSARIAMEAMAGLISLTGLVVLLITRATGPILWFHAVALIWFALASGAFLLAKPWNTQWWLAHAISAAGFLLLGWGVAHVFRTGQSFSAFYSPERLFSLLSNAERLAGELRDAKEGAERSERTKSTFLAAASHDLRQPAQALALFTAALRVQLQDDHPAARVLPYMEDATTALQTILDGLLDVSRLDAGMIAAQLADVELAPLLAQAGDRARTQICAMGKPLDIHIEDSPLVARADPTLLQRTVGNLVDNAVKFSEHGRIDLTARRDGDTIRISVADSGPGVPADKQRAIFEEFVQLDNSERDRSKGLGLGLAIARRLAALMGGRMGVNSRPGEGAVFWIEVPAAPGSPPP
ncbi:MAG: HAMP domain-containing histidine kinase [Magnetospirillum sp.]|nr:HAMP domain-containing histidine kinase [Magnetospirillum sp.]